MTRPVCKGTSATAPTLSLWAAISLVVGLNPIVDVTSRVTYAAKILGVVALSNVLGLMIYRKGKTQAAA